MRILFLASQFPHPARNGATIKTASILEYLRERHDVHLVCLRYEELDAGQRDWACRFAGFDSVYLKRGRNPLSLARSYVTRVPLSVARNRSKEMRELVDRLTSEKEYDAIFVDGWLMAQYLPEGFAGRKVLHEHNAEYVIWQRQAKAERNPAIKPLVMAEARRVRNYESRILRQFDLVFAVSEPDRRALVEIGAGADYVRVLPNLPDLSLLDMPALSFEKAESLTLYFGTLSWQPNVDGLTSFLRDVWPLVRRQKVEARLLIAGQGASRRLRRLAGKEKGVEFVGEVEDPEPLYRRARAFIETTQTGGGTKIKLLNALARGLPAVASPEAIEGLDAVPDEHLLVAARPPSIAAGVVRLLSDAAAWRQLSEAGRTLIRERYTPDSAFGALDEALGETRAAV